jgi:hypothetical protein
MADATTRWSPARPSAGGAVLLVVLGLGLIAHPLYLWPHYGQQGYGLQVERTAELSGSIVEYDALPPDARAAFDAARAGEGARLWSGEDDQAIEALSGRQLVYHEGAYYRVLLLPGHARSSGLLHVRWLLTALGTGIAVVGGLVRYTRTWQPLTPTRALWLPAALAVTVTGTNAYDVLFSAVPWAVLRHPSELVLLIPVTSIAVVVGSAVAAGPDWRIVAIGLGAMALIGIAIAGALAPVVLLVLAGVLTVGGAPWFAVGYLLTAVD